MRPRYLETQVHEDLARKMVFVAGPRQVGKTTLAVRLLGRRGRILSWDIPEDRDATPPFGAPRIRAVHARQKHYHFDWMAVPEDAPRFENLVASHLLKWVQFEQDARGRARELRYFRDVEGREVDFVVVDRRRALLLVEAKWADAGVERGLRYLKKRFPDAAAWQVSATGRKDFVTPDGIRGAPALELLRTLA